MPNAPEALTDKEVGSTVNAPTTTYADVKVADGTWKFKGWSPATLKVSATDTENKFKGTWEFVPFGKPSIEYPEVTIEKGGKEVVTPETKDKEGKPFDPEKIGEPKITNKDKLPKDVTVTTDEKGKVIIEVPEDYNGPKEFEIKVKVEVEGEPNPFEKTIKVIVKDKVKPEPKPEPKPVPEVEIPGIKIRDHYTPTYPVYVSVPGNVPPEFLIHEQYIFGYPDDTIRPDGDMTRAEAIAVVARLQKLDLSDKTSNIYKDTKAGMWYNAAINAAFREGYLLEKEGENIRPNDKITRAELALLISHIDKKNDTVAPFEDVKGHKFEAAINQANGNERIKGYPDGTFKPDNSITRAEVATMLNKLYDRYPDKNFIDANQNLVHNYKDMSYKGHWGYYELVEAYHTHKFARLANNMEEWKAIIK
ncbi:S-layer homology domain-containing protein, partial [Peptoniphilus genitalis]